MSDFETEFSDSAPPFDDKTSHFTQAGQLNDPSLIQLRDQIKKVMIPLLIKTFQFKLELSQALSLPSRLQSQKNQRSPEEITEQLKTLDNDLKVLFLWCQSCRSQIQKALATPEEEQKNTVALPTIATANPAVSKSFSEAVSAQSSFFQQQTHMDKEEEKPIDSDPSPSQKTWWEKLTGK
jgi:hypothetical protein